jgi:hypothetical protein
MLLVMSVPLTLLGLLERGPSHGYDLKRDYDAFFGRGRPQHYPMVAPGVAYYLLTAGGILVALGIIAATFPLLKRITGPEVARNE